MNGTQSTYLKYMKGVITMKYLVSALLTFFLTTASVKAQEVEDLIGTKVPAPNWCYTEKAVLTIAAAMEKSMDVASDVGRGYFVSGECAQAPAGQAIMYIVKSIVYDFESSDNKLYYVLEGITVMRNGVAPILIYTMIIDNSKKSL